MYKNSMNKLLTMMGYIGAFDNSLVTNVQLPSRIQSEKEKEYYKTKAEEKRRRKKYKNLINKNRGGIK